MTKIKILRIAIGLLIAINLLGVGATGFLILFMDFYEDLPNALVNNVRMGNNLLFIRESLLLPALVFIYLALNSFIQAGYFNRRSATLLKRGGMLLIATAIIKVTYTLWHILTINTKNASTIFESVSYEILILIIGFALFIITDFIRKGEAIERENSLTI